MENFVGVGLDVKPSFVQVVKKIVHMGWKKIFFSNKMAISVKGNRNFSSVSVGLDGNSQCGHQMATRLDQILFLKPSIGDM